jgi:tetratricopeptide (TPR) repeat protein
MALRSVSKWFQSIAETSASGTEKTEAMLEIFREAGVVNLVEQTPGTAIRKVALLLDETPSILIQLSGAEKDPDVLLCISEGLQMEIRGLAMPVGDAIRALGPCILVLDHADAAAASIVAALRDKAPDARWIFLSQAPLEGLPQHLLKNGPLSDPSLGLPAYLSYLPAGIYGETDLPEEALHPSPDRALIREDIAARTRSAHPPEDCVEDVAGWLAPFLTAGFHPLPVAGTGHLFGLRWLSVHATGETAILAAVAAARLQIIWGQGSVALQRLRDCLEMVDHTHRTVAMVHWAMALASLQHGNWKEAEARYSKAIASAENRGDTGCELALRRSLAKQQLDWHRFRDAGRNLSIARSKAEDGSGESRAVLMLMAQLHQRSGKREMATGCLEEEGVGASSSEDSIHAILTQAALDLEGDDHSGAESQLEQMDPVGLHPLQNANRLLLLSSIGRRRGAMEDALAQCDEAASILACHGERNGLAGALRQAGAIEAGRGRHDAAMVLFRQAMVIHAELRNFPGLRQTIEDACLLVESWPGGQETAAFFRRLLSEFDETEGYRDTTEGTAPRL